MRIILLLTIALAFVIPAAAQHGGKAEPNRIKFPTGKTSTVVTGTLGRDQEMEYVFGAKAGQTVTVTNSNSSAFDFRVFNEDANVETEFESSRTLTLKLPVDGDYMFFIRKKAGGPKTARFNMTIAVK